jgi:DNA polymerase-3 subunit alpha
MGKKKAEEMAKQRDRFVKGGLAHNYAQKKVEKIFDLMEQFAGYGFNKSHSAAYAFLAFATAYLKAHFPVDFMAALLTSETGNVSKVVKYINECRDMNIKVLPPDVNASDKNFTPDGEAIRFGMGAVKNVGEGAIEAIVAARKECGRFTSIYQFCEKVNLTALNRRVIESLIKGGALDGLSGNRSQLFAAVEGAMESGQRAQRDLISGQEDLFGMLAIEEEHVEKALPNVPAWTPKESLQGEKEMLGFYVTGHPLDQYEEKIREVGKHNSSTLEGLAKGTPVAMCGVLTGIQRRRNREQKPWASMLLEDRLGSTEAMVFTTQFENLAPALVEDQAVLVRGLALPEDSSPTKISVQEIIPLDLVRVSVPSLISIKVYLNRNGVADKASALQELFGKKQGQTQVRLRLENPKNFSVTLDIDAKVRPDREFRSEIERICGPDTIEVLAN